MSYPPDIFGLLQEIRDTLNTNNDPTSQYDASEFGLLQNIRDLLNTGHASTAHYTLDINGLLTNIRDLLNTGNASTASYPPDQYGLWQSIRDFANADSASVASYPDSIYGLIQATRDFLSGGGGGSGDELVFADFENGVYRLSGQSVSVSDIFVQDNVNWGSWNAGSMIVPGVGFAPIGTGNTGVGPVFSETARALLLSGATYILEIVSNIIDDSNANANGFLFLEYVDFPDYTDEYLLEFIPDIGFSLSSYNEIDGNTAGNPVVWGANKVAVTFDGANLAGALNGTSQSVLVVTVDSSPNNIALAIKSSTILKSIKAIPVQDNSQLLSLSTRS